MEDIKQLSQIIEGALFAADKPLTIGDMINLFEGRKKPEKQKVRQTLDLLMNVYAERGIELKELASGFQFQVKAQFADWIQRLWEEKPARYSRALLETLSLIAYRQPITRGEISEVRGVVVNPNIIRTLIEREWIHVVGYRDVPGKPGLYATTKKFLDDLGLKSLGELPPLPEIQAMLEERKTLAEKQLTLDRETSAPMVEMESYDIPEEVDPEEIDSKTFLKSVDQLNVTVRNTFKPAAVETEVTDEVSGEAAVSTENSQEISEETEVVKEDKIQSSFERLVEKAQANEESESLDSETVEETSPE